MFGIHRDLHSYVYGLQRLMDRTDYDRIYPSHVDICVDRDVIPGLITGKTVAMHGKEVLAFERSVESLDIRSKF